MKKRKILTLLFASLLLLVTACSSDDKEQGESSGGVDKDYSELKVAYNAQPPTMDPLMTTAVATRDIGRNIYESLITLDEDSAVAPMLAESVEESEDGKTLTFVLREGVKFHDGSEMTADDVVSSMQRWMTTTGLGSAYFADATFKKVDEKTVELVMPERLFIAQHLLADPSQIAIITKKEANDAATAEGLNEFIGTGPYKFVEWKSDQHVLLEKFDDYTADDKETSGLAGKKDAKYEQVYFNFVTDASTRFAGIQTGEYDIANAIPFDNVDQLKTIDTLETSVDHNGFNGIVFNKKAGFFSIKEARQAVNVAIDEEAILTAAFSKPEFYELESGLMIKEQSDWYSDIGDNMYNQKDANKAKELLDKAGYNGEEIVILATRDYEDHYNAAVVVQQELEKIGMKVRLDIYDWPTVQQRRTEENSYDLFITGFPTEPVPNKYVFLDSDTEWAGWTNSEEIDELLHKIATASDQKEAKKYYEDLMAEYYDYVPIIKFGNKTTVTAYDESLEGYDFLQGIILYNVK
ncbi:ABC transporter substrate-binding protein [Sporosarcina sp. P17b]|uniref:ABC transporter substrate-binding protein n=1 Tax=Sporosarcina sp. P17b TaxID=2048260 RepID=UPI000C166B0E|nr:ABC transporter substrate-binding protein [Sporosarcina sp. P17b]PIC73661.1 ABC transporter substrate-binding protein [Sporosarcina sp. P17b]